MAIARDIKFRAWDTTANKMYQLNEIEDYPFSYLAKGDTPYTKFMQYTGRKDKEDKEIYEDDIIIDGEGRYGLVYWNIDDCQFLVDFQADMEIEQISWTYTVCGNYWENVELLK